MGWQIIKPTRFSIARKGKQCWSRFVRLSSPGALCAVASGCTGNKWFHQAAIVWGRSVCTQHSQQLVYFSYLFIYLHLQPNIHSVERHQYRRNTIPEFVGQTILVGWGEPTAIAAKIHFKESFETQCWVPRWFSNQERFGWMSMIGSNAPTSATTKGEADAAENCQRINKSVITASNEERVTLVKSGKCNKSIGTKTRIDVNPSFVPEIFKKC